ncbi:MAG: DUF2779 domain-containing protein [Bacteroidota bacterium]
MINQQTINRSAYLRDCIKFHFLNKYEPEKKGESNSNEFVQDSHKKAMSAAEVLFEGGQDLKHIAHKLGVTIAFATAQIISSGQYGIYFHPEFYSVSENLSAYADILIITEMERRIIRVKSSTKIKEPQYIDEVGFIYRISQEYSNLRKAKFFIYTLNKEYKLGEELDAEDLFQIKDVTNKARLNQPEITKRLKEIRDIVGNKDKNKATQVKMGRQCETPFRCPYFDHCSKALQPTAIEKIESLTKPQLEYLQEMGVEHVTEIPYGFRLSPKQRTEVDAVTQGRLHINRKQLEEFFLKVDASGPVTFLDFETEISSVPKYPGTHPYQKIPFQFCCLFRASLNASYERYEFIAQPGIDPRRKFIVSLIDELNKTSGPIMVYSETFEKTILQQLGQIFPEYFDNIQLILNRIVDLCKPFKERSFYHPRFRGRYSLKIVYPVLYPSTDYKRLAIQDGLQASHAYSQYPSLPDEKKMQTINDLRTYCYIDVLAMVRVLDVLYSHYLKNSKFK